MTFFLFQVLADHSIFNVLILEAIQRVKMKVNHFSLFQFNLYLMLDWFVSADKRKQLRFNFQSQGGTTQFSNSATAISNLTASSCQPLP